jgi:RND family efflux transporter MFP subunit
MNRLVLSIGRVALTLLFVAGAVIALILLWRHYEEEPWTRDGRLSADVVQVAPDVSGLVTRILVHDNQPVQAGQILFLVDQERYQAQAAQADAAVDNARATLANARREQARYLSLGDLVSREVRDQRVTASEQAAAQLEQARANQRLAAINLERSAVRARVNGYVTGFSLRPGDYVAAGSAAFAIVDTDSYYVLGYFEETKLHRFAIGDRAKITLLGDRRPIWGHVDSLSAGITDREQTSSSLLLPNVTPTFSWIRLAQRVPVRVVIDRVPPGMRLVAGRTATVSILRAAPAVVPRATPQTALVPNTVPRQRQPDPAAPAAR